MIAAHIRANIDLSKLGDGITAEWYCDAKGRMPDAILMLKGNGLEFVTGHGELDVGNLVNFGPVDILAEDLQSAVASKIAKKVEAAHRIFSRFSDEVRSASTEVMPAVHWQGNEIVATWTLAEGIQIGFAVSRTDAVFTVGLESEDKPILRFDRRLSGFLTAENDIDAWIYEVMSFFFESDRQSVEFMVKSFNARGFISFKIKDTMRILLAVEAAHPKDIEPGLTISHMNRPPDYSWYYGKGRAVSDASEILRRLNRTTGITGIRWTWNEKPIPKGSFTREVSHSPRIGIDIWESADASTPKHLGSAGFFTTCKGRFWGIGHGTLESDPTVQRFIEAFRDIGDK